jgi:uncharacterized protein (DUF305 family)
VTGPGLEVTGPEDEVTGPGDEEYSAGPPGQRFGLTAVAVLAALTLVIGLGAGFLLGRSGKPGDDSVDAGFARDMSTHHAQAVSMGMTIYRSTHDEALRQVALDISLTQQAQIGIMQTWLDTWGLSPTASQPPMTWMGGHEHGSNHDSAPMLGPDGLMPGMATGAELEQLKNLTGKEQEILFCQLMIRHHLGGISMAKVAAAEAATPSVRRLAQQMVDGQQYEIGVLTDLLTARGAEPLPN